MAGFEDSKKGVVMQPGGIVGSDELVKLGHERVAGLVRKSPCGNIK